MQVCKKCGIRIRGSKYCCPLCEGELAGEPEDPAFPVIPEKKVTRLSILRVAIFVCVIYEVVMVTAWGMTHGEAGWIPTAILLGLIALADVFLVVYHRNSLMKLLTFQTYVAMLVSLYVDVRTHFHGWSVTWVFPCAFAALTAAILISGACMHLRLEEYGMYLAFNVVLSMTQIVFILLERNFFVWPAVICMAAHVILGAGGLIFRTREVRDSAARYFNV